jgi:hypothetical protein
MVSALAQFVAASILAAVAPRYAKTLTARGVFAALGAAVFVPAASAVASALAHLELPGQDAPWAGGGAHENPPPYGESYGFSVGRRRPVPPDDEHADRDRPREPRRERTRKS